MSAASDARASRIGERVYDAELLDGPAHELSELSESLRLVDQVNRLFAGNRSLYRHLSPYRTPGVPRRVLDVGTGNGACALRLRAWAQRKAAAWTVVGLDRHEQIVGIARVTPSSGAPLPVVRGDALNLPFSDDSFDIAFSSLTLHHFADGDAVKVVREMARVSRIGVAISDLERGLLGLVGAKVLASTLWRRSRLTRNDGPLSVRRAFTPDELAHVGRDAGLGHVRVHRHFPCRLALVGSSAKTDDE